MQNMLTMQTNSATVIAAVVVGKGGGGGGLTSNPLPYHHCSHVSQPKIDQVELLRFYETPVVASRAYIFYTLQRLKKHHEVRSF